MASRRLLLAPGRICPHTGQRLHVMVQGSVRTREYEKDGIKQRVFELRADSIGKLDRAERKQEGDAEPENYDTADP